MNANRRRDRPGVGGLGGFSRLAGPDSPSTRVPQRSVAWLPWLADVLCLALLGACGWLAAGKFVFASPFVFGDHPGQFMRYWYPLAVSLPRHLRVVDWNPLWYAGYPELQFYPPGHALTGLLLNFLTLGRVAPERLYNLIPAVALVLPAFTGFAFLRATLAPLGRWPARLAGLAAALLALAFTPMWGGTNAVPIGLLGERLAFGLVPLALLAGWRLVERPSAPRLALAALLLAALVLMHPFHAPAVVLAVVLYAGARRAVARGGRPTPPASPVEPGHGGEAVPVGPGKGQGQDALSPPHVDPVASRSKGEGSGRLPFLAGWLLLSIGLVAWWLVPLAVRQSPYAASLVRTSLSQTMDWLRIEPVPLLIVAALPALALLGYRRDPRPAATVAALWLLIPLLALGILFDTTVLFGRFGLTALDPIRFIAEYYMALLLLAGAAVGAVASPYLWRHPPVAAALALLVVVSFQPRLDTFRRDLAVWSQFGERATLDGMLQNPALAGLWQALRDDPAADGRVLFTSYYTKLRWPDGEEMATAIKAMTPYLSGREIVGGTFSHWSPVARMLWVGDPWVRLLPERVELEDGLRLFGRPWSEVDDAGLYAAARALNVTTIVVDAGDEQAHARLETFPHFERYWDNGYFTLYHVREWTPGWIAAAGAWVQLLERTERQWTIQVNRADAGAVLTASMTYYPLWRAEANGRSLEVRPGIFALQEITLPPGGPYRVTLYYHEGWPEWLGFLLTVASLGVVLAALTGVASRRSGSWPWHWRPRRARPQHAR